MKTFARYNSNNQINDIIRVDTLSVHTGMVGIDCDSDWLLKTQSSNQVHFHHNASYEATYEVTVRSSWCTYLTFCIESIWISCWYIRGNRFCYMFFNFYLFIDLLIIKRMYIYVRITCLFTIYYTLLRLNLSLVTTSSDIHL